MNIDILVEEGIINKEALRFDNPSFDNSIIGVDYYGRLVYDYNLMVEELVDTDKTDNEDAADFIGYNTLRSLNCQSSTMKPIVIVERIEHNGVCY